MGGAASAPQLRWYERLFAGSAPLVLVALDYGTPAEVRDWVSRHGIAAPVPVVTRFCWATPPVMCVPALPVWRRRPG